MYCVMSCYMFFFSSAWCTWIASGLPVCMAIRTLRPLKMSLCVGMKGGENCSLASSWVSSSAGHGSSSSRFCTSSAQEMASMGSWKAIVKASPSVKTCRKRSRPLRRPAGKEVDL